mgnify:CR=1 FL=1
MIDEVMRKHFHAFPQTAPPMAMQRICLLHTPFQMLSRVAL